MTLFKLHICSGVFCSYDSMMMIFYWSDWPSYLYSILEFHICVCCNNTVKFWWFRGLSCFHLNIVWLSVSVFEAGQKKAVFQGFFSSVVLLTEESEKNVRGSNWVKDPLEKPSLLIYTTIRKLFPNGNTTTKRGESIFFGTWWK